MFKKPLFLETVLLIFMVGLLDFFAHANDLYWSTSEFDSLVHFVAGGAVAMFFLWFYFHSGFFRPTKRNLTTFFLLAILSTLFVAALWEAYEVLLKENSLNPRYPSDTALDFTMALLAASAASFYGYLKEIKNQKNEPA